MFFIFIFKEIWADVPDSVLSSPPSISLTPFNNEILCVSITFGDILNIVLPLHPACLGLCKLSFFGVSQMHTLLIAMIGRKKLLSPRMVLLDRCRVNSGSQVSLASWSGQWGFGPHAHQEPCPVWDPEVEADKQVERTLTRMGSDFPSVVMVIFLNT